MKIGKQSYALEIKPKIISSYSIVGPKEGMGELSNYFDTVLEDDLFGEKTFEIAESKMQKESITGALNKCEMEISDIDAVLAGDLLNQIFASSYSARELDVSYLGLYGACSTFGESLVIASLLLNSKMINTCCCTTSSHFSSAERQYRFPLELGNQRTPTSQWTVTGAGTSIISTCGDGPEITGVTIGRVVDFGVDDVNNMGAAMAPAAADTIMRFLSEFKREPDYYDMILTGDLGRYGSELVIYLCEQKGIDISSIHRDCGAMIYKPEQRTFQGGSGAGCSSSVFNGYVINQIKVGKLKKVLFVPTGALLSKDSPLQGETIPAIAHAVSVEV